MWASYACLETVYSLHTERSVVILANLLFSFGLTLFKLHFITVVTHPEPTFREGWAIHSKNKIKFPLWNIFDTCSENTF